MPLPSEYVRPDYRVEMRFGGTWVDVTDRLLSQSITVRKGRSDESAQSQPNGVSFELSNLDGALTPDNPSSPWWPHVRLGAPCRIRMPDYESPDASMLNHPGIEDALVTPDDPALAITGDIDVRWWGSVSTFNNPSVLSKWSSPDEQSWVLWFSQRRPRFTWISTSMGQGGLSPPDWPLDTGDVALRVEVIQADPLTGRWYLSDHIDGPWELYYEESFPGNSSDIVTSTAPLQVANINNEAHEQSRAAIGQTFAAQVRDGIGGTLVADARIYQQPPSTTSWTDSVGREWTVAGDTASVTAEARCWGEVVQWSPTWPHGDISGPASDGEARVSVTVAGVTRRLSQGASPLQSTLVRRVTSPAVSDHVIAYWPLEDGRDAQTFASPTGAQPAFWGAGIQLAADDTLPASAPLPTITKDQAGGWVATIPPLPVGADRWRIDHLFRMDTWPTSAPKQRLLTIHSTGTVRRWEISSDDTTVDHIGYDEDDNVVISQPGTAVGRFVGGWIVLSIQLRQDGPDVELEFGWITVGDSSFSGTNSYAGVIGRPTGAGNLAAALADDLSFGHLAVTTGLPFGWLAEVGETGGADTAFDAETARERIMRLAAEEGISARVIGGSDTRMGPQGRRTLMELLQEAAATDMGILVDRDDTTGLWFRTRQSLYNQDPAVELDAARGGVGDIVPPFEPVLDDQTTRNDVTAKRDGGSSYRAVDQESIDTEGRYETEATVNTHSDGALPDQAGWRLRLGTWPGMRYPAVTSELSISPDVVDDWVAARLGDRVTVDQLPPQHPATTVDLLAQQLKETMSLSRWTIEATTTPGGPWTVAVRDEPVIAVRDTAGTETTASFEPGTDTSLAVEATVGGVWADTSEADLPFDIEAAGVRLTVTAISVAVGQAQTFTVDQTPVNDVVKMIPAGTPVHLRQPAIRAL